jgi:nicotinamidase-related amidase
LNLLIQNNKTKQNDININRTDECIVSTAYAALSRGYDVIVANDGVATATANHEAGLTIINATSGNIISTKDIVSYMNNDFVLGEKGAVKGITHPDGR